MAPQKFYAVASSYTDGAIATEDENGVMVPNQPDPNKPDIVNKDGGGSFWRQCVETDAATRAKADTFKRTLGQGIQDSVNAAVHTDHPWFLESFPLGYTLWELVSYTILKDENGNETRKNKRSDTYLFGHPGGITKKYRSPKEFLPHLLWILQDPTHDRSNCACRHCKQYAKRIKAAVRVPEAKVEEQPKVEESMIQEEENHQMDMGDDLAIPSSMSSYPDPNLHPDLLTSHYSSPYTSAYPPI